MNHKTTFKAATCWSVTAACYGNCLLRFCQQNDAHFGFARLTHPMINEEPNKMTKNCSRGSQNKLKKKSQIKNFIRVVSDFFRSVQMVAS